MPSTLTDREFRIFKSVQPLIDQAILKIAQQNNITTDEVRRIYKKGTF